MADVWQVAMDMEAAGREHYRELAASTTIGEVQGIFTTLANDEQKHYELFEGLQKGMPAEMAAGADVGAVAKEAFGRLAAVFDAATPVDDAAEAYAKALSMEQGSIEYYTEIRGKTDDLAQKSALEVVIAEEKRHEKLMQALVEFVNRPAEWLENAEFNHLDEY